jgi:hypothetical protein
MRLQSSERFVLVIRGGRPEEVAGVIADIGKASLFQAGAKVRMLSSTDPDNRHMSALLAPEVGISTNKVEYTDVLHTVGVPADPASLSALLETIVGPTVIITHLDPSRQIAQMLLGPDHGIDQLRNGEAYLIKPSGSVREFRQLAVAV